MALNSLVRMEGLTLIAKVKNKHMQIKNQRLEMTQGAINATRMELAHLEIDAVVPYSLKALLLCFIHKANLHLIKYLLTIILILLPVL